LGNFLTFLVKVLKSEKSQFGVFAKLFFLVRNVVLENDDILEGAQFSIGIRNLVLSKTFDVVFGHNDS